MNILIDILKRLETRYKPDINNFIVLHLLTNDIVINHFEIMLGIILSQNTSDKNAIKALNNLRSALGKIEPETVLKTSMDVIANAVRVAGITNRRVKTIYELAKWFINNRDIIEKLALLDIDDARNILMQIYGVGPKTADVYLLMVLHKPSFPIDTHIRRVLTRIGLASQNESYENVRKRVMKMMNNDVDSLKKLHILLIEHGRNVCKAKKPLCSECVLKDLCRYYNLFKY